MLTLEEAQKRILDIVRPLEASPVNVASADGRVLAVPIVAPIDLPPFDNSAMDGYAVRADDVKDAGPDRPVTLRIVGQVAAGENFSGTIEPGQCLRLFTGSPLPLGTDAVVMQEDTQSEPNDPKGVRICDSAKPWENVRFKGEDVKSGRAVFHPGELLNSGRVALLAAMGISQVRVSNAPRVGILATGSELREGGDRLAPGQIYESNRVALASLVRRCGGDPHLYPLVPDTLADTTAALQRGFNECDAIITSGGVSVGAYDFVKAAFENLGGQLSFWKVAVKPGKPFVFGELNGKYLFGLPGNPVSAMVTFLLLVRPALMRMQGALEPFLETCPGTLAESLHNRGDRRHFMRVSIDSQGHVRSAGTQASHMLHSLALANGLIDLPPESSLPTGTQVKVFRWD